MTFWKCLCVGGDVSGREKLKTSDRTDKDKDDEEECEQVNFDQTTSASEKVITDATHETNSGPSSWETDVSSADSKNGPESDSASSVSLLEVSKDNDPQYSSTDDSEKVKFKQFENMCIVKK